MLIKEYPYITEQDEKNYDFIRHYSDEGHKIVQNETGRVFEEALDRYPCKYTYSEYIEKREE